MTCRICGGLMIWHRQLDLVGWLECPQCHGVNCQIEADEPSLVIDRPPLNAATTARVAGSNGYETPEEREVCATIWGGVELGGEA